MKKNAIVTACNAKYEDFLAKSWYASLVDNVDLSDIDVVVLDYGLSEDAKSLMPGVVFEACVPRGHIVNARYDDLSKVLSKEYEQILMCDGGDIIFQADISNLFAIDTDEFRCVVEGSGSIRYDRAVVKKLSTNNREAVTELLSTKNLINVGFIIGPTEKFKSLREDFIKILPDLDTWGFDTMVINYLLYRDGFVELAHLYNFIIINYWGEGVRIKEDRFYTDKGVLIPVVHNAGGWQILRPVLGFGYKKGINKLGLTYYLAHPFTKIANRILGILG